MKHTSLRAVRPAPPREAHGRRAAPRPPLLASLALALAAAAGIAGAADDPTYVLGIPSVPTFVNSPAAADNAWLAANTNFVAMGLFADATGGVSRLEDVDEEPVRLLAAEGGFAIERTKPDYYLADRIDPPPGVDWAATYAAFLARPASERADFLFDSDGRRVFAVNGGALRFTWVLAEGGPREMVYNVSPSCSGRPRRIYWTDYPYNAPAIDLSGKFVKFFGPASLVEPAYGVYTNTAAGITQVLTNRVVSGLLIDPSTHLLYAYGRMQGQVVMAYYDTGLYERLLHVQAVEIRRPVVNRMTGAVGRALRPDGRGYDTAGLLPRPTRVSSPDNRGDYYYQHQGRHSYSPKHGEVYPLRPTADAPWNMEVYWMETDEMLVQWPFELDQYACDWPADATVFVRGDVAGDGGRPIYVPSDYTAELMKFQEPEGHARAVQPDGTFATTGEGWSLLRLATEDDVWFVPLHSILRSNRDFFTLAPEEIRVGAELRLRGGTVAGLAPGFAPVCDPDSPGYVYAPASDPVWNDRLYQAPQPDNADTASATNLAASASAGSDTNEYASVVYAVSARPPADDPARPPRLEVWWNTTIDEEGMPRPLEVPTLPQVYSVRWPEPGETPQIVIASQLGSAAESVYSHNEALHLPRAGSSASLPPRRYFDETDGGTAMFWAKIPSSQEDGLESASLLGLRGPGEGSDAFRASIDLLKDGDGWTVAVAGRAGDAAGTVRSVRIPEGAIRAGWIHVALRAAPGGAELLLDGRTAADLGDAFGALLEGVEAAAIGRFDGRDACAGASVGEVLLWNRALPDEEIVAESLKVHAGRENHLTGCFQFRAGEDLVVTGTGRRFFTDKVVGTRCAADGCLADENGPPALGAGVIEADASTTPRVYAQNDPAKVGYNPNEEHALVLPGSGGHVAWALRSDLNSPSSSAPGVLVEFVRDGRKAMRWFDVAVTNALYPELAADCVAGRAFPGPHPIDLMDDPWCPEDTWDEPAAAAPAFRDRKGQLWARAAGTSTMRMYYRMQEGFAFPSIDPSRWPAVGESVPWLSLLGGDPASSAALSARPAPWTWRITWPDPVPEIEIGRTLTVAESGLPEVWNAKSMAVVWPAGPDERNGTAYLIDPTVAQTVGFSAFGTVAEAVAALGIRQGAGGNATLRKGRWTFDGLPPSLSRRFYLDTTADVTNCLRLVGEMEDNPAGVSLLHVNVLDDRERQSLRTLLDDKATAAGKAAWHTAIDTLARWPVPPTEHRTVGGVEDVVVYKPRDHYALFTPGYTNYVTLIENDATNEVMDVAEGDPIQMRVLRVVPKYHVGRVVTREDPLNLLSQQLSVLYSEAFAGMPEYYEFEWRKCRPHADGSVPTDYEGEYTLRSEPTAGLTRFVVGGQGDTLANMVNTYYAVRYRAASTNAPSWKAMGDAWSGWSDPPALAEGWVQRVLNNVTPFAQRMRDFVDNEAETAVSMLRQAGGPYEGDVALSQDNLASIGLIQLYETILSKAESMSLLAGIDDADANKQLQLAVARLADLYSVLGDEAYTDALNPTIGFGVSFNTASRYTVEAGALSSALFCFDNQVPTLLDEELALLRGRSGANAPSTHLSPYYNRLPWNVSKSPVGGEVAYMVNYGVSDTGAGDGLLDANDAARLFPQGHGDAYGHYLSALSGYYRLLRNPFFTWGAPAMGEMVVADAVLNVDYYDEAKFAKAAYDVAKTAALVVDRTARKAWRDSGGAPSAGYLDDAASRNFGYGEWASRGGFGALANWVVANALLEEAPDPGRYYRYSFRGRAGGSISAEIPESHPGVLSASAPWTVEFQLVPDILGVGDLMVHVRDGSLVALSDRSHGLSFVRSSENGEVSVVFDAMAPVTNAVRCAYWFYTNAVTSVEADGKGASGFSRRVDGRKFSCLFAGPGAPADFPAGYDPVADFAENPPEFPGWGCVRTFEAEDPETGATNAVPGLIEYEEEDIVYTPTGEPVLVAPIGEAPAGRNTLVALRHDLAGGSGISPGRRLTAVLLDADGALLSSTNFALPDGFLVDLSDAAAAQIGGSLYRGEIGEIRVWDSAARSDDLLRDKRGYVSPRSDGLALYLRPIVDSPADRLPDQREASLAWTVSGGRWIEAESSGMNLAFEDEGLLRIDRSTVPELASLAGIIPDIQKRVDRMDAGLTPLGLAAGALSFDLTPIGPGEEGRSHYEQIRERAGVALANARRSLEKAQQFGSRLRILQEVEEGWENATATSELETKNKLIEYFGYPYAGDIGPGGTYPQGYDGPDLFNYAWMEPELYGLTNVADTVVVTSVRKTKPQLVNLFIPFWPSSGDEEIATFTFRKSASGIVLKPRNVSGRRRAQGKIQDALADFLSAYARLQARIAQARDKLADFESSVFTAAMATSWITEAKNIAAFVGTCSDYVETGAKLSLTTAINSMEAIADLGEDAADWAVKIAPEIIGAGTTVNTDPSALVAAASGPAALATEETLAGSILAAKNALAGIELKRKWTDIAKAALMDIGEIVQERTATYTNLRNMWYEARSANDEMLSAFRELQIAQSAVEAVAAEAERVIDERTLARQQASGHLTKARYSEMLFRLARNNALSRYDAQFELAQKYAYLAARAYDYETGLLSSDPGSGDSFLARIVGARTLGEFDAGGNPTVCSDDAKGDGGLASVLAEMDANWLVLKPRLGINNPQPYATWFSLRHDLFRIYAGAKGDGAWRTQLRKFVVDDLNALPEFRHYCQPLAGSVAEKEPGIVIPFPTMIAAGFNFFGEELAGGDASLDPTYFATHVSAAGIHLAGYDDATLARTPAAYLVPVGEDRMRAVGDQGTVLSWKVVDQTVPAPYAIGSSQLDDPDWTPLFDGATGGNDLGARIRRHPSFRAYYGPSGQAPSDDSLDCRRLVGRSAWNTRWLLIIPASTLGADREAALSAFIGGVDTDRDGVLDSTGVSDILLGLRTYSTSGN